MRRRDEEKNKHDNAEGRQTSSIYHEDRWMSTVEERDRRI
jgi:hypothetical protein